MSAIAIMIPAMVDVFRVSGAAVKPHLEALASLRIRVFREFPYLYDGSEEYEREYLHGYTESEKSVVVLATNGGRIVGASTGLPLTEADPAFQEPFQLRGIDPAGIFYFGESVIEADERGRGIGHRFFTEREMHARICGFSTAAFCSVIRSADHLYRPPDFRPLDSFWSKRGFEKRPDLVATMAWPQIDSQGLDVNNQLVFWGKSLVM